MVFEPASDILSHITVLDLTRVRSGPTCVRQLADWGANVIKIEAPHAAGADMGGSREGSDFQNLHRNKRYWALLNLVASQKRILKKSCLGNQSIIILLKSKKG